MRNIVSLTSFGERIYSTLPQTLDSILKQDEFTPDLIKVFLAKEDYDVLDKSVFCNIPNIEFEVAPNYRSYKKYLALTKEEFDNDFIWVIDDDINFHSNTYSLFRKAFNDNLSNNCFFSSLVNDIGNGMCYFHGNSVFFPPKIGRIKESRLNEGFNLAPTWDDIFLSILFYNKELKCKQIGKSYELIKKNNKYNTLSHENINTYKGTLELVLRYFNFSKTKIVVSISIDDISKTYDKIHSLINQTLKPNRIILTSKKGTSFDENVEKLKENDIFEIQYTDKNVSNEKWIPKNVDDDSVLIILNGDRIYHNDFILRLFSMYNDRFVLTSNRKISYYKGFGYKYIVGDSITMLNKKSLNGLSYSDDDYLNKITKVILSNKNVVKPISFK